MSRSSCISWNIYLQFTQSKKDKQNTCKGNIFKKLVLLEGWPKHESSKCLYIYWETISAPHKCGKIIIKDIKGSTCFKLLKTLVKHWPWAPLQEESGRSSVDFHSQYYSRSLSDLLEWCDLWVLTQTHASGLHWPEKRSKKNKVIRDLSSKKTSYVLTSTFTQKCKCFCRCASQPLWWDSTKEDQVKTCHVNKARPPK